MTKQAKIRIMCSVTLLMSIGFIMITRLNYDKAAKQYLIAAAGIVLCLVIPIIIRKVRFLSEWRILYGIVGIVSLAVVVVVGRVSYGAMLGFTVAGINIQPSELVKIVFVFFVASSFKRSTEFKDLTDHICGISGYVVCGNPSTTVYSCRTWRRKLRSSCGISFVYAR